MQVGTVNHTAPKVSNVEGISSAHCLVALGEDSIGISELTHVCPACTGADEDGSSTSAPVRSDGIPPPATAPSAVPQTSPSMAPAPEPPPPAAPHAPTLSPAPAPPVRAPEQPPVQPQLPALPAPAPEPPLVQPPAPAPLTASAPPAETSASAVAAATAEAAPLAADGKIVRCTADPDHRGYALASIDMSIESGRGVAAEREQQRWSTNELERRAHAILAQSNSLNPGQVRS